MAREDQEAEALLAAVGLSTDDWSAAASATARSRRRWLRQQAMESATMAGALLTLAERDETVTIRTGGGSHRGRLRSVTTALCILDLASGGVAVLRAHAVVAVEGRPEVADDRVPGGGPGLESVLGWLVAERPRLCLLLADGTQLAGILTGLGKDVASLRLTSSVASVRISAIEGIVLPAPGSENWPWPG